MSIEQTEFLTTIEPLDGDRLERVMQTSYEGMPNLPNDDRILALSPEQKKELSAAINLLDGGEYLKSEEEVDVDIEGLSPAVLTKLWSFVVVSQQAKRATVHNNGPESTSGNASKGGVKRKGMDEEHEMARIRKLQEQLKFFIEPNGVAVPSAET